MIIGLTGGIASGKSTACRMLASHTPMRVFDADQAVGSLLDQEPAVASGIQRDFGARFLAANGKPDRAKLREAIYADLGARRRLEGLLHPLVRARWLAMREECLAARSPMLADIPLLYETGAEAFFDVIVAVGCTRATQLDRLKARGIDRPLGEAMLASQWSMGQKLSRADMAIWNDGSPAALARQTKLLAYQLFPA